MTAPPPASCFATPMSRYTRPRLAARTAIRSSTRRCKPTISHRVELEFDLRSALTDEQFFLVYQPIYNLADLTVVGVEALLRWQHPTNGLMRTRRVHPDPRTDRADPRGWPLGPERGLRADGRLALPRRHARPVSQRLRRPTRHRRDRRTHPRRAHQNRASTRAALIIEVTETALMRDAEATARRLQAIKDLGVRIAVDDFGTGYSSLAYLQQFPVDCLKIDRMFTSAITHLTRIQSTHRNTRPTRQGSRPHHPRRRRRNPQPTRPSTNQRSQRNPRLPPLQTTRRPDTRNADTQTVPPNNTGNRLKAPSHPPTTWPSAGPLHTHITVGRADAGQAVDHAVDPTRAVEKQRRDALETKLPGLSLYRGGDSNPHALSGSGF